jgi:hypothetical protein
MGKETPPHPGPLPPGEREVCLREGKPLVRMLALFFVPLATGPSGV